MKSVKYNWCGMETHGFLKVMEFSELITTPNLDDVKLITEKNESVIGTLCITGHHLIFSSRSENFEEIWLLHRCIDTIDRQPMTLNSVLHGGLIVLKYKNLRIITIEIRTPNEYINVGTSLEHLSRVTELTLQYAFSYRPMFQILEDGYLMYGPEGEHTKLLATEEWRLTKVNKDFSVCPTYAPVLLVPKVVTDEQIIQSAAYRDGGRFPILSYRHENGALLMRSSQPSTSARLKRSFGDEEILNTMLGRNQKGFIVDTWNKGKSNVETDYNYSMWKKINRSIGCSTSGILDSFAKLIEACNETSASTDRWLSKLESSNWLTLVLNSLNVACVVAQCLHQDCCPVLVHGGKGTDSTLIVTSLAQIILNPDCRTIRGFQALIEREWIQAGYPFSTRHKYSCYSPSLIRGKSASATFTLFLDCVHQLFTQFTCSFEFTLDYLIQIFDHSYASQYGTFLGDCEKERYTINLQTKTTSLWSYLNCPDTIRTYMNPLYEPNTSVIWPSVAPVSLVLWTGLYLRWNVDQSHNIKIQNRIRELVKKERDLKTKVNSLQREVSEVSNDAPNTDA